MPRRRAVRALALVLLALVATPVTPQRSDLDRIRTDITRLRTRLQQVRQQAQTTERELEESDLELGIQTRELDLAIDAESRLVGEEAAIEQRVSALGPAMAQQKEDLRKRLVTLYRLGGLSYIRILLALDDQRNPVEAMSMLSYLVTRDARAVTRFQSTRVELAARQQQLNGRRTELRETRLAVEERRRALEGAVARKQNVLATLRKEETGAARELAVLEEKARRLQRLVDALKLQKQGIAPALDIVNVKGALAWPVQGKITERFGKQRNPKFATVTINNGLKIEAAPGTEVRAVFQGTVLFSQWFKGYGNLIIVDHGSRIFSLYGNVKAPTVAVGGRVNTGQPIAGVGESEDEGGHLYFEIRQDGRPEDPQKWLR